MDKSYLWKRHNIYWVRVRVPDKVRSIIGKSELSRNLYTSDLSKANNIKHSVIAEFKKEISRAEHKIDGSIDSLSKEYRLKNLLIGNRAGDIADHDTSRRPPLNDFTQRRCMIWVL